MRKLMWFAVGFTAACAAGVYLLSGMWPLLIGLFCLIGFLPMLFIRTKPARIAAAILLGCVIGFGCFFGYDSIYLSAARNVDGETVPLTVVASDYSYATHYGQAFDGRTELDGKSYQIKCYLNENTAVAPGDVVEGEFRLRYTSDGGKQEPTFHQGKGIFLLAYEKDAQITGKTKLTLLDYAAVLRQKIAERIHILFPSDVFGFAKALLLGDSNDLTYTQNRRFQVSGIRHVIAVSGLHVSILFALIYLAFGRNRVWNALIGVPLLIIFAAVAGFSPSIVRACIMQCLILLSMLVNREYDPPTALAFAVLVILGFNPKAITSASFQLSVGCMIGIFAFSETLRQWLLSFGNWKEKSKGKRWSAKLIRWFTGSVAVTLSAMLTTTPLCAIHFGMVSLLGILTNLLTLWVVSFIFYGIMLACLLSGLWLPLGQLTAWVVAWPIRYVIGISGLLAKFPLAAVYTDSRYIVFWLIFSYVFLGIAVLHEKKRLAAVLGIVGMLVACVSLSWWEPKLDDTRVSVIDVGQGQSILLQSEEEHYLVDCGGVYADQTADAVANLLLSQGIFQLDGVILTHYDADHAGSILNLLTVVDTDRIYMPDVYDSNGIREQIAQAHAGEIELVSGVVKWNLSGGNITLYPADPGVNDNESSVCVLFQSGNCDILITGDRSRTGERALLSEVALPRLELLVAGHHGSKDATSLELLTATQPRTVAISVGANNSYGHPSAELLDRLTRCGCEIYRTDLQGTIIFRG